MAADPTPAPLPVLIAGAGISGLLLAQHLRKTGIPYQIFERDASLDYRGVGWGLTLHWSLPAMRALMPDDLVARLPEAYVDRAAVAKGVVSNFPFYDLATGERKAETPDAPVDKRVRVTRQRLRKLLLEGIDVQWGKGVRGFVSEEGRVTVNFDGSSCTGCVLVACDGGQSRIRRQLIPGEAGQNWRIPVGVMGMRVVCTPEEMEPIRKLDSFFMQGASSVNDTFAYLSILEAPGDEGWNEDKYGAQLVVSWPLRKGWLGKEAVTEPPATNEERMAMVKEIGETWGEPFRSFVRAIPTETDVKPLELGDFPPPKGLRTTGNVALVGDALHAMAMYRGEGANHAIIDVKEFADHVTPTLLQISKGETPSKPLREALNEYEDVAVARTRSGVLASRRACLDGHEWSRINDQSPLLTPRMMRVNFDEVNQCLITT